MSNIQFKSYGRKFLEEVSKAKNKEELFDALRETCSKFESPDKVDQEILQTEIPASPEIAKLKATMAKIKIQQSDMKLNKHLAAAGKSPAKLKKVIHQYVLGERMFRRTPDYAAVCMHEYIEKKMGTAEDFKKDFRLAFSSQKETKEAIKMRNPARVEAYDY